MSMSSVGEEHKLLLVQRLKPYAGSSDPVACGWDTSPQITKLYGVNM